MGHGAYWRDELIDALALTDSRWSVEELLKAIASCDAGLVHVAGWLSDEMRMGRVGLVVADDPAARPLRYMMVPGSGLGLKASKRTR
jgi:hypothetical protein